MSASGILGLCLVGFAVSLMVSLIIGAMASIATDEPGGTPMCENGHRAVTWGCTIGLVLMLAALVVEAMS